MRSPRLFTAGRPALLAITLFLAGAFSATVVRGGTDQAAQPAGLTISGDAGLIFSIIKPDQTSAYEAAITKLKEAFGKIDPNKIDDPALKQQAASRKQQAASWTIYKAVEPGPNGTVLYVSVLQPAVKDADYNVFKIISEAFPTEATELYKAASGGFVSMNKTTLLKLTDFK
ncbi:MAG: hypothetical protein HYZ58_10525 [Acidobacteria bacterium]|nr:hypothetical protein [Acidobacteriota bacterium]MBI3263567.1 hypothetical protein [Acidobacteriota bacterium]